MYGLYYSYALLTIRKLQEEAKNKDKKKTI